MRISLLGGTHRLPQLLDGRDAQLVGQHMAAEAQQLLVAEPLLAVVIESAKLGENVRGVEPAAQEALAGKHHHRDHWQPGRHNNSRPDAGRTPQDVEAMRIRGLRTPQA